METTGQKKGDVLKKDLFSTDQKTVLNSLKKIGEDGTKDFVEPVLELFGRTQDEAIRETALLLLSQLKIGGMEELFIQKLEQKSFSHCIKDLIFCMWNSGMNPSDHLHILAQKAIEEDHEVVLEVLTLVENMEGPFDHESLTDAFSDVGLYVSDHQDNTLKLELMKNLYSVLHAFQEEN